MNRTHKALTGTILLLLTSVAGVTASANSSSPDQWGTNNFSGFHSCTFPMNVTEVGNLTTEAFGFVTHIAPGGEYRQQFQNYSNFGINFSHAKAVLPAHTIWGGGAYEMTSHGIRSVNPDCQPFG